MALIVGLSVLMAFMVSLVPAGPLALLYCMSTHYTTRGGSSNNSYICGLVTTGLAGAYNYTGLHIGAALE